LNRVRFDFRRNVVRAFVVSTICFAAVGTSGTSAAAATSPSDPFASQQWGLTAIGAPQVWQFAQGAGVTVAVVDSGSGPHPDLASNLEVGRRFFSLIESEGAADVDLDDGHGTHVAGIIGAVADNGIGIAGVAPKVRLLPIHVLDAEGSGDSRDVARGIRFATDSGARVINLSLGGSTESSSLTSALQYAVDKGVLVVAASGNGFADSAPKWPAASDLTLAVTSTDVNNNVGIFAQRGDYIDISAPGVGILSTSLGGYKMLNGTSMSAAFISGAAALLFSAQQIVQPKARRYLRFRVLAPDA
jgi:subtilisin family serine protease